MGSAWMIGRRFRRMRVDPMTGVKLGLETYTLIEVERPVSLFPQRGVLRRDRDDLIVRPDLASLWSNEWQAIDNITPLVRRARSAGIEVREVETNG